MEPEIHKKIVQGLAGGLKNIRLYPLKHPAISRQIDNLLADLLFLLRGRETVRIGLLEGTLFLEDHLFTDPGPAAEEIRRRLQQFELYGLEFLPGFTSKDLGTFLFIFEQGGGGAALEEKLDAEGITHIRVISSEAEQTGEEENRPRQIYGRAIKVMETIFNDVRMGRIPSSIEALEVVQGMARLTLAEPHALFALSMLKDYDNYTFTHSVNVSILALAVGRACGLSEEQLRILGFGGLLHDLGKLKIDIGIITKPGRLTEEEFAQIRHHPRTGADLVKQMENVTDEVIDIVLGHHMRYDKGGYPADARGRTMSPLTDMTTIADTYDAITTLRSYQRPLTPRKAIERLRELTGVVLHPKYTEEFIFSLGTYPVGSLVRLDNNEIGLVVWVDTRNPDAVQLKILFNAAGEKLPEPHLINLSGQQADRIVAEVDPFIKGIEVAEYFD